MGVNLKRREEKSSAGSNLDSGVWVVDLLLALNRHKQDEVGGASE